MFLCCNVCIGNSIRTGIAFGFPLVGTGRTLGQFPLDEGSSMDYLSVESFTWDVAKSNRCARERGFDFAYAAAAFADPHAMVWPDLRHDYGEARFQLLGRIEDLIFLVVFTPRMSK